MSVLERPSLRSVLRARTDAVHRRLEQIPVMQRLLDGSISLDHYTQLLHAYRRFYSAAAAPLQAGYAQLHAQGFAYAAGDALSLLDADLADLKQRPETDAMPTPAFDAAQAVGWVWVVEGSVMGGQVIDRALSKSALFGQRQQGRRFFQPGPDLALRWQSVCATIERYGERGEYSESVAVGAATAFACIERSLTRTPQ